MRATLHPLENHFIQCQEKQKYFPAPCFLSGPRMGFPRGRKPVIEDNIEGKRGQGRQGKGRIL